MPGPPSSAFRHLRHRFLSPEPQEDNVRTDERLLCCPSLTPNLPTACKVSVVCEAPRRRCGRPRLCPQGACSVTVGKHVSHPGGGGPPHGTRGERNSVEPGTDREWSETAEARDGAGCHPLPRLRQGAWPRPDILGWVMLCWQRDGRTFSTFTPCTTRCCYHHRPVTKTNNVSRRRPRAWGAKSPHLRTVGLEGAR